MTAHHLNLARPSPDRIIEANRPHRRDWLDAHRDYVATGKARYRDERDSYEADHSENDARWWLLCLMKAALFVASALVAIRAYCLLLAWTGGAL